MIKFSNSDKTLTVISGLGNFPSNSSGGSDVTRQDVVNIVNSAITEYDAENQADLEEIREDVSGNTEDIAAHGAALADMRSDIDALSGTARDIRWDVDSISAQTSANTTHIASLSAATEGIEGTVRSVVSNVETISGQTSANTAHIETLSGVVQTNESAIGGIGTNLAALSGQVETLSSSTVNGLETAQNAANSADTKASSAYTLADSAYTLASSAYTRADAAYNLAESLTGGSDGNYLIVNSLSEISDPVKGMLAYVKYTVINKAWVIDASQISENYAANIYYDGENYTSVYRSGGGEFFWNWNNSATDWAFGNNIWYKIDTTNGLFYAACDNPAAYITLENGATSAETTAQITLDSPYLYNGTEWEKKSLVTDYFLENMTSAERLSLYNMLMDIMGGSYDGPGLTKVFSNYRFFTAAGQIDGQNTSQVFFSNFENGGVYFCGTKASKISYEAEVYRVVAFINGSDGSLQTTVNSTKPNTNDFQIRINSNGYISSNKLGDFSSLAKFHNFVFVYQDENITNNYCAAPLKYFYRKNETVNDEEKLVEYIGVEININGTWYKGDWHFVEYGWDEWIAPDTWTAQ